MSTAFPCLRIWLGLLLICFQAGIARAETSQRGNLQLSLLSLDEGSQAKAESYVVASTAPQVRIVRPPYPRMPGSWPAAYRIKALVDDPDGDVFEVRFYADGKDVGVRTEAPFTIVWVPPFWVNFPTSVVLMAVARDLSGLITTSAPVPTLVSGLSSEDTAIVHEITQPLDGSMFARGAPIRFTAEALSTMPGSDDGTIRMHFYADEVLVETIEQGTRTIYPFTTTITNLTPGRHALKAYLDQYGYPCPRNCPTVTVQVVELGLRGVEVAPDGSVRFETVTAFLGRAHVIQISTDVVDWVSVSTNVPAANVFEFRDPDRTRSGHRFYRAVVLP